MNKTILIGRLTKDVDLRFSQNDNTMAITRFTIAVDRRYKSEQSADFISCIAFGKTAEFIEKYFSKGMKIGITGRLQSGTYTNKEQIKIYTTDVVVEEVEFVEKKAKTEDENPFNEIKES